MTAIARMRMFTACLLCVTHVTWIVLLNLYKNPMRQVSLLCPFLQMWKLRLKLRVGTVDLNPRPFPAKSCDPSTPPESLESLVRACTSKATRDLTPQLPPFFLIFGCSGTGLPWWLRG